jgi:hypothetical protein
MEHINFLIKSIILCSGKQQEVPINDYRALSQRHGTLSNFGPEILFNQENAIFTTGTSWYKYWQTYIYRRVAAENELCQMILQKKT